MKMNENEMIMTGNTTNEMALADDEKFIMDLTAERKVMYCSMQPKNEDEEIILYNAMNNPEKRLKECINMTLNIKDVFCEVVQCEHKETGEMQACPRIVLIDDKGVGYQCVSLGIFSALKKIFAVKGQPCTWKKPVKLEVKQILKGDRALLTINMVK